MIYIDWLVRIGSSMIIHRLTAHRLVLVGLVCAAKFWDDEFYTNNYYARVGGVPLGELNKLELDFLFEVSTWMDVYVN